jgi:hypothetical protein
VLDDRTIRGIVLALIKNYRDINEAGFEETISLLQHAPSDEVRTEAATITETWNTTKDLDPMTHPRLTRNRRRLIDDGVQRLEVLTRLKDLE